MMLASAATCVLTLPILVGLFGGRANLMHYSETPWENMVFELLFLAVASQMVMVLPVLGTALRPRRIRELAPKIYLLACLLRGALVGLMVATFPLLVSSAALLQSGVLGSIDPLLLLCAGIVGSEALVWFGLAVLARDQPRTFG